MPARPYMERLSVLSRLTCPSAWPLLQGCAMACLTASMSRVSVLANCYMPGVMKEAVQLAWVGPSEKTSEPTVAASLQRSARPPSKRRRSRPLTLVQHLQDVPVLILACCRRSGRERRSGCPSVSLRIHLPCGPVSNVGVSWLAGSVPSSLETIQERRP
jgi:hypothetical protein